MAGWDKERRHRRFPTEDLKGSFAYAVDAQVINISLSGLALQTATQLSVGRKYSFRLGQEPDTVYLQGTVKWCRFCGTQKQQGRADVEPVYRAGIAFDNILTEKAEELLRFMERNVIVDLRQRISGRFKVEAGGPVKLESVHTFKVKTLSLVGMLMETDLSLEPETRFEIEMRLNKGSFASRARVVHTYEAGVVEEAVFYRMGIEFVGTPADHRQVLENFIREELAKNI